MDILFGLFVLALVLGFYFLPSIIASARFRNVRAGWGIVVVNLFFGWTLVGWLAAFVWACVGRSERE